MLRSLSGTIQDRYPTDTPLYWIAIPLTSHASSTTSGKRWTVVVERNLKMIPSSLKLVMHALLSLSLPSPCASKVSPNSLLLGDPVRDMRQTVAVGVIKSRIAAVLPG